MFWSAYNLLVLCSRGSCRLRRSVFFLFISIRASWHGTHVPRIRPGTVAHAGAHVHLASLSAVLLTLRMSHARKWLLGLCSKVGSYGAKDYGPIRAHGLLGPAITLVACPNAPVGERDAATTTLVLGLWSLVSGRWS